MDETTESLQDDLKVLKNEIKQALLDIREQMLTHTENPFAIERTRQVWQRREEDNGEPPKPEAAQKPPTSNENGASGSNGNGASGSNPTAQNGNQGQGPAPQYQGPAPQYQGPAPQYQGPAPQYQAPAPQYQGPAPQHQGPAQPQPQAPIPQGEEEGKKNAVQQPPPDKRTRPRGGEEGRKNVVQPPPPEMRTRLQPSDDPEEEADLLTVATLASWLESGIRRVGQRRLKGIVEVYASMGELSPQLQEILLKLIGLENGEGEEKEGVSLRDCFRLLAELDSLLWRSRFDSRGAALLSVYLAEQHGASQE